METSEALLNGERVNDNGNGPQLHSLFTISEAPAQILDYEGRIWEHECVLLSIHCGLLSPTSMKEWEIDKSKTQEGVAMLVFSFPKSYTSYHRLRFSKYFNVFTLLIKTESLN